MTRNMIQSQAAIFYRLCDYSAKRGEPVPNQEEDRWIAGSPEDIKFLNEATTGQLFSVTPRRAVLRMDHGSQTFFGTVGLEGGAPPDGFLEDDLTAGQFSVLIYETSVLPNADALVISNAIGGSDRRDKGYIGHPVEIIRPLFANTRVYTSESVAESETWRVIYEICVASALAADTWMEKGLGDDLLQLSALANLGMPFQTLCRSVFDTDPGSLFLALYRCLEALYAYRSARKLKTALGIQMDWAEIAKAMELELGWRPKEEDSLQTLMALATLDDLNAVFCHLGVEPPNEPNASLLDAATKRIYKLRNVLLHFRPVHHSVEHSGVNWNGLCSTLCTIIARVYSTVYQPEAIVPSQSATTLTMGNNHTAHQVEEGIKQRGAAPIVGHPRGAPIDLATTNSIGKTESYGDAE